MSILSLDNKLNTIDKNEKSNVNKINNLQELDSQEEEEEKIVQYKNLPPDLNSVSLKTRFTYRKMLDLMENNKDDNLNLEDINDPSKAKINKQKFDRKLIQYYCVKNVEKNKFASPSEKTMKKIQEFKKWQKYEIFQKDGIKKYLNNILPDYKLIYMTKNLIDNKINIYRKIRIKRNHDSPILPYICNTIKNYQLNKSMKDTELFNDQSQSYISLNEKKIYKKRWLRNKSTESLNINTSKTSKMKYQSSMKSSIKIKKLNSVMNNQNSSLINIIDNSKNLPKNKSLKNIKSFEDSTFCFSKVKLPFSINKSITTSPYGGGIFHSNSLLRNKSMNDLLDNPSQKSILARLNEYKTKRSRIINSKDYLQHIGKTFVTINKHLGNYDYNFF